jgi:hypothetical protein
MLLRGIFWRFLWVFFVCVLLLLWLWSETVGF